MGFDDPVPVDEEVEDSIAVDTARVQNSIAGRNRPKSELIVVLVAAVIFLGCAFSLLGVHDWAGRLPLVLLVTGLCWVTARFGRWAFGIHAGLYSGLVLSTCIGLFLFTRILIP